MKNKELEILDYIAQYGSPISIEHLSQKFELNQRSIRYYLDFISRELFEADIQLDRGVYRIGNLDYVKSYLQNIQNISASTVVKKLRMFYLYIFNGHINLSKVSNELEISRVTTKQYFSEIETKLLQYNLTSKYDNNGIYLVGQEETIRSLQLQTLLDYSRLSEIKKNSLADLMFDYIDESYLYHIDAFLKNIQSDLKSLLTDFSYHICRNYLIVAIKRIQKNKSVSDNHNYNFLVDSNEYQIINKQKNLLEINLNIQLNHSEIVAFTDLLIGSHYSFSTELKENTWFENNLLVTKIIANFSKYINLNLNQDSLLYNSLMAHIKPTMYRMLHNLKLNDINSEDIIKRFKTEFEVTQRVLNELKFFTNNIYDKDEIALITLHFKTAINRYNSIHSEQIKVLIVCSQGYGTSRLLEQQLNEIYSVEIADCIPSHYLSFYENIEEINLIITTIKDLSINKEIPIICVNPILSSDDFKRLDHSYLIKRKNQVLLSHLTSIISENCIVNNQQKLIDSLIKNLGNIIVNDLEPPNYNLLRFLPIENILIIEDKIDWQTAISVSGNTLVNNGFVSDEYTQDMIKAFENYGSYMVIDDGIAIPHAKNVGNVYQTGIVLTICRQPVLFNEEKQITAFFAFCSVDHQEHLDALVAISNLIRETDFKSKLTTFVDENEVVKYISCYIKSLNN